MARKLICKLTHERGQKVAVAGTTYTIGLDGAVEVDDAHAPLLLQNTGKWADPALDVSPFKRPASAPQPILEDRNTDRELAPEEVEKLLGTASNASPAAAPEVPASEPTPAAEIESEPLEPEPAPQDWPEVSTNTSKADLLAVLDRLQGAGFTKSYDYSGAMSKKDMLEVIERAYDSMS
jgi:hypothetical protein